MRLDEDAKLVTFALVASEVELTAADQTETGSEEVASEAD